MGDELRPGLHLRARLSQKARDFIGIVELNHRRILERCIHRVDLSDGFDGQRLGVELMAYVTGSTKQAVAESRWCVPGQPVKKTGAWKRVIAMLEDFPNRWLKYEDLTPDSPAAQMVFELDAKRFMHAVEFGCPAWGPGAR